MDLADLRRLYRPVILAVTASLVFVSAASADTVRADGDAVTPGTQTTIHIGEVAPGAEVAVPVTFELRCSSQSHADPGQAVDLAFLSGAPAPGGTILSVTSTTLGPVPGDWPADGTDCPDPLPTMAGGTSIVTLRAPTAPNVNYTYTVGWNRTVSPAGSGDTTALNGTVPNIAIRLDVVTNTAPVLTLPADMTVEGDTTGGWTAAYPGVSAADAEDDPDPVPVCSPAAGEVLPLGTATVACTATDSGGRDATGSFDVTVVDTTDPTIAPTGDISVASDDPAGAVATWPLPAATDVVDPAPDVACLPASGAAFPVGTTTVTCAATDGSGNSAADSFDVVVTYEAPDPDPDPQAGAAWGEPVGDATSLTVQRGRTLPIKVRLFVDGVERTSGTAHLALAPCGGGSTSSVPLFHDGRWTALLRTGTLDGDCYTVTAVIDGLDAGGFELRLRPGDESTATGKTTGKGTGQATGKATDKVTGKATGKTAGTSTGKVTGKTGKAAKRLAIHPAPRAHRARCR